MLTLGLFHIWEYANFAHISYLKNMLASRIFLYLEICWLRAYFPLMGIVLASLCIPLSACGDCARFAAHSPFRLRGLCSLRCAFPFPPAAGLAKEKRKVPVALSCFFGIQKVLKRAWHLLNTKKAGRLRDPLFYAVRGGFEPPEPLPVRQFSKLLVSATHPPHRKDGA
jgi:hypothetical protein